MKTIPQARYPSWELAQKANHDAFVQLQRELSYHAVITATADYTADGMYRTILVDCTAGAVTVTLPSAASIEGSFSIKKIDSTANAVTVDGAGSETIDGNAAAVWTAQYDSYTFASNQSNWFIV